MLLEPVVFFTTFGDAFDEHWLESSQEPQDSLPALATPPVVTSTDASNIRRAIMLHFSNKSCVPCMYVYMSIYVLLLS